VNGKCVLVTLGVLVSSVLILTSCGSGATTSTPAKTTAPKPATTTSVAPPSPIATSVAPKPSDKPKYGGTYTGFITVDTGNWDPAQLRDLMGFQISITNEPLMMGDWAKGPAGTNESSWQYGAIGNAGLCTGQLAESYEIPDNQHIIFHIRKGVHYWNKPPANGREFTAEDAAWNIKVQWDFPGGNFQGFFAKSEWLTDVKALDKYTVQLTFPANSQGTQFWEDGQRCYMMLKEGFPNQKEWKNNLGTGAFMVTDWVSNTAMTFTRNPDYWQKNPVGPGKGDQLPYLDGFKLLVIPDLSTRLAAFRTGKLDSYAGLTWEDFADLQKTTPYPVESVVTYGANVQPTGREDKAPFDNLKVRQALNLAIDKQAILKDYYKGHGQLLGWPYYPTPEYSDLYIPLEQLPTKPALEGSGASVQELIKGGNPEKAKQLLKEAGYPNGFKTSIYSYQTTDTDFLSIIKAQLAPVGVDLDIKVVDGGVYRNLEQQRTFEQMFYKPAKQYFLAHYMFELRKESQDCPSFFDSPEVRATLVTINKTLAVDDKAWRKALKDLTPYMLEQAIAIWLPVSDKYNAWQPWLKNYYGASTLGAMLPWHWLYFSWMDTDQKSKLTGR
jgi:peptide/nickel transport system substrate-binding protein